MLYAITHRTVYGYETEASLSHHLAHLRPRETPRQQVLDFRSAVDAGAGAHVRRARITTATRRPF